MRGHVQAINPIGQIYINILLATVGPQNMVAIVSAITSLGSLAKLRSIGLRSVFWLLVSNALAVVLALGLALAFQPGNGVHDKLGGVSTDTVQGQVQAFSQVVVGFFPRNVVQNFGSNDILPIILIAVTLSVAYLLVAEKDPEKVRPFRSGAEALKLVTFKAVGYVIRLTPYAIVALTAYMVGSSTNLGSEFSSLAGLLALVWVACLLHTYRRTRRWIRTAPSGLVTQILREAEEIDQAEDRLHGKDRRGDELPEELRTAEGRRQALADAKRRLEERKGRPVEASARSRIPTWTSTARARPSGSASWRPAGMAAGRAPGARGAPRPTGAGDPA